MNEYRLVIDTLKECISDLLASGSLDQSRLSIVLLKLEKEKDKAIINRERSKELDTLIDDIKYVKYEL
mgnify:CR=1 FL=1